nr:aldehyde dehydrogenase family protein [Sphingomonas sp. CDS-1]
MQKNLKFYIDGQWVDPLGGRVIDVIDPATEAPSGQVALGTTADVDRAVEAARRAFDDFSRTAVEERLVLFDRIIALYKDRMADLAHAMTVEMGAPTWLSEQMQAVLGLIAFQNAREILASFAFSRLEGTTRIAREPIGVCALITPWNWPVNQVVAKVAPALATGCTMLLKPSEVSPFSATILAEIMDAAGVPPGVFNLVHGDGPGVGARMSEHPEVDLVSFTGSTRAGVEIARAAAPTVKRVCQELGGKSANIILPSADLAKAVSEGVATMMMNSGQNCNAPSRMLVPAAQMEEVKRLARIAVAEQLPGPPQSNSKMGPVVSELQWMKIQKLIEAGMAEGATLVAGGLGKPEGLETGYYVKPTVFADVTNDMTIAREEIFGPVLTILGYEDVEHAIRIANDTPYGLAGYVQGEPEEAQAVAARLRAGQIMLNGADYDFSAPFGGYKQSGNGREWGKYAFDDFLEYKAVIGAVAAK